MVCKNEKVARHFGMVGNFFYGCQPFLEMYCNISLVIVIGFWHSFRKFIHHVEFTVIDTSGRQSDFEEQD